MQTAKTTRLQVLLDTEDREKGEEITQEAYGLSLSQTLRLVVKKIINKDIDFMITSSKTEKISPAVAKQVEAAVKSGLARDKHGNTITHHSVSEMIEYLESDD